MKILAVFFSFLAVLLISDGAMGQQFNMTKNLRQEQVITPPSTPDRNRMAIVQTLTFVEDELGAGVLVFYDDDLTKWKIDYIELYDLEGNLLVVTWLDHFGACQVAIDQGLLDTDDPSIDGILVILEVGTML
jgi:hypothetical protein